MEPVKFELAPAQHRKHLFYETSHSPSLADLVGYEKAKDIIDFCFIANPVLSDAGDAATICRRISRTSSSPIPPAIR